MNAKISQFSSFISRCVLLSFFKYQLEQFLTICLLSPLFRNVAVTRAKLRLTTLSFCRARCSSWIASVSQLSSKLSNCVFQRYLVFVDPIRESIIIYIYRWIRRRSTTITALQRSRVEFDAIVQSSFLFLSPAPPFSSFASLSSRSTSVNTRYRRDSRGARWHENIRNIGDSSRIEQTWNFEFGAKIHNNG